LIVLVQVSVKVFRETHPGQKMEEKSFNSFLSGFLLTKGIENQSVLG